MFRWCNRSKKYRFLIRSAASFDIDGIIIKERNFPSESKLMYKAASGAIEYINIFEVSNINSTLKNLKDKNFWVYGFDGKGEKNLLILNGKEIIFFYLDLKDLVCINIHLNMQIF